MSFFQAQNPAAVFPFAEKLKALPGLIGIRLAEEPQYYVVRSGGEKEIRKYGVLTMASVTLPIEGGIENTKTGAFLILANYLFGKNKDRRQMDLLSPILKRESSGQLEDSPRPGTLSMSFVLPAEYSLATAPEPTDKRIVLHERPSSLVACLGYRGTSSSERVRKYTIELRKWISQYPSYRPVEGALLAEYDRPATLDMFRKNEVHIELKSVH